jgi:hypothetical protein
MVGSNSALAMGITYYADSCFAFFLTFSVPGGTFKPPKTKPHTATMPAAPIAYAVSRPAHQYKEQKIRGPSARPTWPISWLVRAHKRVRVFKSLPKLLWLPSLFPLSSALASKEDRLFSPVTTVALVTASSAAAPYKAPWVSTLPKMTKAMVQLTTPI